jgi:hypothetical protein
MLKQLCLCGYVRIDGANLVDAIGEAWRIEARHKAKTYRVFCDDAITVVVTPLGRVLLGKELPSLEMLSKMEIQSGRKVANKAKSLFSTKEMFLMREFFLRLNRN